MLAISGTRPARGAWAYEVKWDGIRVLVARDRAGLHLVTRRGNDVTKRYPELAPLADELPIGTVLDGEIVALDRAGRPDFQLLQSRMHVEAPDDIVRLAVEVPVTLMVFDALAIGEETIVDRTYLERRERLAALALSGDAWRTPRHEVGDGTTLLEWTRAHELEGVVAKRVDSRYRPGRRSSDWVKIKHQRRQEFVVGGWLDGERSRASTIGALLVGYWELDDDGDTQRLRYAGRVGTGFNASDLERVRSALDRIACNDNPFAAGAVPRGAHFVEPVIVVEVRFADWTLAGSLRAPVFCGVRSDKDPHEVVRES
jgi:bifunctional non-homologous end joining protein LigD